MVTNVMYFHQFFVLLTTLLVKTAQLAVMVMLISELVVRGRALWHKPFISNFAGQNCYLSYAYQCACGQCYLTLPAKAQILPRNATNH